MNDNGGKSLHDTLVTFSGLPAGISDYTIANDITLKTYNNNTTWSLFAGSDARALLTGVIKTDAAGESGTTPGILTIKSGGGMDLAGGLSGNADLAVTMNAASLIDRRLGLLGNNADFTKTLSLTDVAVVVLNSTGTKTFGGSINTGNANLTLGSGGQSITGDLSMGTGTFTFNTNDLAATTPNLSIGGNLSIGSGITINLDNTGAALEDGDYTLIGLGGTLTGSFSDAINWLNGSEPDRGTITLTYDTAGNKLVLSVRGFTLLSWAGANGTGTGTWAVGTAGWGNNGADTYTNGLGVLFSDVPNTASAEVTISGTVNPEKIKADLSNTKMTFKGDGVIADQAPGTPTALLKTGTNELVIANTGGNTFSGGTTVENGTLTLQANSALGTGTVTLKGGSLKLDAAGDSLLNAGNKLAFNGGELLYTTNATQDVSTLIDAASTGTVKVGVASGHDVTWSKAVNDINLALTKTGAGSLDLNLTGALTKLITVSAGTLKFNVNTTALDISMLAGDSTANATLINKGNAAVAVSGTTAFAGNLTLANGGFNLGTMGNLNSVSQLTLAGAVVTLGANASFGKTIDIAMGSSFVGGSATLSGALTGTEALSLSNTAVTLTGDLTNYTGAIINGSTLNFGNGTAATLKDGAFIGSTALNGTGTYTVNYTNATNLNAIVGGSASLTQKGSGVLSLTGANTSTGTLTIDQNTTVDLAQGGSWAGTITGAGTLQVSSNAGMDLSNLSGATSLKQTGTGTITLNHGTPGSYSGEIAITGGGTLDLQKAYGNKITMNKGSLVNGSNASNVHVEATGDVNLGGVSGSSIKSLNSTGAGALISGITGNVTVANSNFQVGVNNLSTTEGSDGSLTGTPIIRFTDNAELNVTGTLTLKVNAAALETFLTGNRDLYLIDVTNGSLQAGTVDFDNYLTGLGYRYEGIVGGGVQINGKAVQEPYLIKMGEEKTITNPSELDIYPSVVNQGIWNIDIAPDQTIVVKELEGRAAEAMINTGKSGSTVELNNNNDNFTSGTNYDGSIRGDANIVKTGQYGLTIGGSVQTSGNLDVQDGRLSIGGATSVNGTTSVADNASLNTGGPLQTGSLQLGALSGFNMNGNALTLNGNGMTSNLADGATLQNVSGIALNNGALLTIGSGVNLGGAGINWQNAGGITTASNITLTALNGSGELTLNNATATLDVNDMSNFTGQLSGNGTLIKKGQGTQVLRTSSENSNTSLIVEDGNLTLGAGSAPVVYNDMTVGTIDGPSNGSELLILDDARGNRLTVYGNGTLSLGGNVPDLASKPTTLNVGSANFHSGSTLNMIIPNDNGSVVASGSITLPTVMTLNLLNNGTFDFDSPPQDLVIMKAEEGYIWGDGDQSGQSIAKGTVFNQWKVAIEKSISLFFGSADVYVAADGKTLNATPIASGRNSLLDVAQSANATAGANMLWAAGLQPTASTLDLLLSSIMDDVKAGNNTSASRKMAASVGSTYVSMLSAQQAGFRYQQTLIRNRMTGMGLSQEYQYTDLPYFNAWVQGNGSYDKLDSRGDEAGFDLNTWGGTVGFDTNLTPNLTVGAAFTASYGDLNSSAADSLDGNLDMYYVNLFAQYKQKKWTHALILTGAWGEADVTRTVSFGNGLYQGKGKTDASSYGAMYELTYDIAMNKKHTTILQPLFNASIQKNKLDGFNETGAGNAGLNVDNLDSTTGSLSAGARLLGLIGSNVFGREAIGEVRAQLVQDIGSRQATGDVAYQANPGFTQRVIGSKIGGTGVQFGVGLTVPVGQQGSVFADGNVDLRSHATSANGSIGYRYNF